MNLQYKSSKEWERKEKRQGNHYGEGIRSKGTDTSQTVEWKLRVPGMRWKHRDAAEGWVKGLGWDGVRRAGRVR